MMLAVPGSVFCISVWIGGHAFNWGYSRILEIDPWGLGVTGAFRKASSLGLRSSWAECFAAEAWLFRPAIIQLIPEQDWMRVEGFGG